MVNAGTNALGHGAGRYSRGAIIIHWLTAAAFAFQMGLGWRMDGPRANDSFSVFQLHKSVGITILLLTVLRIIWRFTHRPPPLPADMAPVEKLGAHAVHTLFYILLLGLPLTGWVMVSSSRLDLPTYLYSTIPWPHIPGIRGNEAVKDAADNLHGLMAWIAVGAIALHVLGALKHQWFEDRNYLARMTAAPRNALLALSVLIPLAVAGVAFLGRTAPVPNVPRPVAAGPAVAASAPAADNATQAAPDAAENAAGPADNATGEADNATAAATTVEPSGWTVRMAASSIRFKSAFSMGPIDGGFAKWKATILFDPEALDASSASVSIDMASATAADSDQQGALPEADWFAAAANPTATWKSTKFRHSGGNRYIADGRLTLRGVTRPLQIPFTLTIAGDSATMNGTAKIDRTTFGVGQGEWTSTADVPALVNVAIAIKADRIKK